MRKVPKRVALRRLEKKADKALSLYIRALTKSLYDGCPLCKENPVQACFHFIRRRRKVLRWDPRNVIGSCHKCNWVEYRFPDPSRAWYIRTFGVEQYLELVDKSAEQFQPTPEFLAGVIMACEKALSEVGGKRAD
jgi:hypothetical protein